MAAQRAMRHQHCLGTVAAGVGSAPLPDTTPHAPATTTELLSTPSQRAKATHTPPLHTLIVNQPTRSLLALTLLLLGLLLLVAKATLAAETKSSRAVSLLLFPSPTIPLPVRFRSPVGSGSDALASAVATAPPLRTALLPLSHAHLTPPVPRPAVPATDAANTVGRAHSTPAVQHATQSSRSTRHASACWPHHTVVH